MINMKSSPEEAKEMSTPSMDLPQYPYGLRLSLNQDSLEKLKMKTLPKVGDEMTITAKVKVCAVSAYESEGGGGNKSVDLQITDMDLGAKKVDAGKKLYGEGEE